MKAQSLDWIEPLQAASHIEDACWALLYSGVNTTYSGRYSLLALNPDSIITDTHFTKLAAALSTDQPPFSNSWFGYLGYGLKRDGETLPEDPPGQMAFPDLWMARFASIYRFDHEQKTLMRHGRPHAWEKGVNQPSLPFPAISHLRSNMSRREYLHKAATVIEAIRWGDLYQANLTRKFFGNFTSQADSFTIFQALCAASPAAYSAYIKTPQGAVCSSSPERFLKMDATGRITARPIKGSMARHADAAKDEAARQTLADSEKNRAENLMIVDLMRNDFSRSCVAGSVKVERLFDVTSHAHVHHMSSTITGVKRTEISPLQAIHACFPPGSMTGAPKLKAISLCNQLEPQARGIYSGALGWLGGDGSAELSVVIRTILIQGNAFEFQVGGGIVADSTPESEWQETMVKARGMALALGITMEELEGL